MFYRGKRVLVTGGSGFVGTHLVEGLLKQEAQVRVAVHNRPMAVKDDRMEIIQADLQNPEDCVRAAESMDYVFHAAGTVGSAGLTPINMMDRIVTNLVLTAQMLRSAWKVGVQRFLVFSSSTGYPASDHPVREEQFWAGPADPAYFGYAWMRRYLERLAEFVASKSGMKIALVRPTAVYGRWDDFKSTAVHVIPDLIRRAVERRNPYVVWGTGNEVRDFLHVSDLACGCLLMLEHYAECDPVNIGSGEGVTIREIVEIILKAAGAADLTVRYDATKPTTIPFRVADISKATHLFGFRPSVPIAEGIRDTVSWYIERSTAGCGQGPI